MEEEPGLPAGCEFSASSSYDAIPFANRAGVKTLPRMCRRDASRYAGIWVVTYYSDLLYPESATLLSQKMSVAGVLQMSSYPCCSRKSCTPVDMATLTDSGSSHSTATKRGRKRSQSLDSRTSSSIPSTSTDRNVDVSQEACKLLKSLQVDKLLQRFPQLDGIAQF